LLHSNMNKAANNSPQNDLENENFQLRKRVIELEATVSQLTDYLRLAQQARFGRKSEKLPDDSPRLPGIGQVFDECAITPEPKKAAEKRAASGGRKPLPSQLPREEVTYDIDEHAKVCPCGHPLHCIGREESEQLEIIPAQVKVIKNVRLKYGCKACEDTIILAKMPPQAIPKSMAAPGLLAHILVAKFDDHLPLHRQAEMWTRADVDLDRTTLGRWVMKCGDLLSPLAELMEQDIVSSNYVQADETGVQVLNEEGRKNTSKSQMWVFKTGGAKKAKILYKYSPTRSSEEISSVLSGFAGYLQSDGYAAYAKFAGESPAPIINLGCWAHARRKFVEITKVAPKKGIAFEVIQRIARLYAIEKDAKATNLNFAEIYERRQQKSRPILEELKVFLDEQVAAVAPKSTLGIAINYTLKNWEKLIVYLERGDLEIDNNSTERAIRPFAVGRKNWLFKGCVKGAQASSVIYSLIETAKSYDLNPYDYLRDILIELPKKILMGEGLQDLLPSNWQPLNT